ncbi:MAG: hypothetical protein LC655_02175, partial [Bacteroidales bacterium]|nr:hypothetical protein [Bacteroidales bacterium]
MAKRDKYRKKRSSDFFDYSEGKMSDQERHAFERRMQKDSFDADAAEGFSRVSREEAEQDLQSAAGKIRNRIEGHSSGDGIGSKSSRTLENENLSGEKRSGEKRSGEKRNGRSRRIVWYSAAAAFASLMIVATVFFQLNDNGLERFETAPEMREAAREKSAPLQEIVEEPADEVAMKQVEPVAEEAMGQEEPAGEGTKEQEKLVQEKLVQEKL